MPRNFGSYRLNTELNNINHHLSFSNIQQNNFFEDEEEDVPQDINHESTIFDAEEYYNYNLILNAYFNRQLGRNLTYDILKDKIDTLFENEKNGILEEKEDILKGIKNFNLFRESYLKQKRIKKEELRKLYLDEKEDNDNTQEKKEEIQIEFSTGEIIKEDKKIFVKYPSSILAACINNKISLPKRKNSIFLDRNYSDFKLVLYFLKKSKLPKFKNISEENSFFKELDFWKIPIKYSTKKYLQFDLVFTPSFFKIDKSLTYLTKLNNFHGITLLNKSLKATSPYIEFIIYSREPFKIKKKFFLGLVDKKKFNKGHINCSFEDKSAPFVFYWDVYQNLIIKNKKQFFEMDQSCFCSLNNYEIKIGMKYDQKNRTIILYRNDIELNLEIKNIEPGLTPAIELDLDECRIQLLQNNEHQDLFYL